MKRYKIKNKKVFVIGCIIIFILVVLIIYIINLWINPKIEVYTANGEKNEKDLNSSGINSYSSYVDLDTDDDIYLEVKDKYFEDVERLTNISNIDELYNKMDQNFLKSNNLNRNNFEEYLIQNKLIGELPAVVSMQYSIQENNVCVYRITYINYMEDRKYYRYINFIETKPYEYTVDFNQEEIPTVVDHSYIVEKNGLIFEIKELYRTSTDIGYKVKITNNNEYNVKFDFNTINSVELKMEDGGTSKQSTAILSSTNYEIPKNSFFVKNLFFPIDMQYQGNISGMIFYSVLCGDVEQSISIDF